MTWSYFLGCISSISYNGRNLDTDPNVKKTRVNVEAACPCESLQCENGGVCVDGPVPSCQCAKGWSGIKCTEKVTTTTRLGEYVLRCTLMYFSVPWCAFMYMMYSFSYDVHFLFLYILWCTFVNLCTISYNLCIYKVLYVPRGTLMYNDVLWCTLMYFWYTMCFLCTMMYTYVLWWTLMYYDVNLCTLKIDYFMYYEAP